MSKLNQGELLKILGDSIEEGRRNTRDLKGSLDISQDEFDERFHKLNQAEHQTREMIQKSGVTEKWTEEKEEVYRHGIRMTLRYMSDLMRAWEKYKGNQTLGEFAIELLGQYKEIHGRNQS